MKTPLTYYGVYRPRCGTKIYTVDQYFNPTPAKKSTDTLMEDAPLAPVEEFAKDSKKNKRKASHDSSDGPATKSQARRPIIFKIRSFSSADD